MSVLGTLAVNLLAKTRGFDTGIDKSRGKMNRFRKEASAASKAMRGFGTALVGAVGIAGMKSFVFGQLEAIDKLGKTARRLDITTQSLQAYQHAASLSGLTIDQLTTGLEKMQDTVGAALMGEAGAIKAFQAMGLSAEEVSKSGGPLELIQERLAGIEDQNLKLSITRDIFGRSGSQMLNLFESNLAGVREEYETIARVMTGEEVKKVEAFNDALTNLGTIKTGIGQGIIIDVSDVALDAVEGLRIILENVGIIKNKEKKSATFEAFKQVAFAGGLPAYRDLLKGSDGLIYGGIGRAAAAVTDPQQGTGRFGRSLPATFQNSRQQQAFNPSTERELRKQQQLTANTNGILMSIWRQQFNQSPNVVLEPSGGY